MDDVDAEEFGRSDWLKAIGGVTFFVAGVLPWWKEGHSTGLSWTFNAFSYNLTGLVPYVIFVAIAILTIIIKTEQLPLPRILIDPVLTLGAATVGTVLVGIRFFMDGYGTLVPGQTVERGIGLYLAAISALVVLAGSVLAYREDAALVEDTADGRAEVEPDDDGYEVERARSRRHSQHPPLP